jgi:hypothetical protein
MDRKDLKIQAQYEKIMELMNLNTDLRVELTIASQERDSLQNQLDELKREADVQEENAETSDETD